MPDARPIPAATALRQPGGPWRAAAVLAVLAVLAAACGDSDDAGTDLAGTRWGLQELGGEPAVPGSNAALNFPDMATFTGNTGCNAFSGGWSSEGSSIALEVGPMTRAFCPEEALQVQEAGLIAALGAAAEFSVSGDGLELRDASGDSLAVFAALEDVIAGTSWNVVSYNNGQEAVVSLVVGSEITADFGADGEVTGFAGCNDYTGTFTTEGERITLSPLASTLKACEPDIDAQEAQFYEAMANAATFQLTGPDRMEFRSADGALQVMFTRSGS